MTEKATFAAGCFWGVEAAVRKLPGVTDTKVGFIGGTVEQPSYEDVIYRDTGHAEAVQITFDPKRVSYATLLELFWLIHDPTQVDRQGHDVGSQYRSVIFTHSDDQQKLAEASKRQLENSGKYSKSLATEIRPASEFYVAEDYHQQYLAKNPGGYCHVNMGAVEAFVKKVTER